MIALFLLQNESPDFDMSKEEIRPTANEANMELNAHSAEHKVPQPLRQAQGRPYSRAEENARS
jgi:hypothetical protein